MTDREKFKQKLKEVSVNGKISCTSARKAAEELGMPMNEVGKLCDELGLKIHSCELGCF
ncbi:MAG: hypothetical protein K9L17_05180 [Clostridiales bacterium]|nr:hypothetical protein [Clostridiales bacterium]MCF8022063.1 hypothetical protein [Clostridiales bacterium]